MGVAAGGPRSRARADQVGDRFSGFRIFLVSIVNNSFLQRVLEVAEGPRQVPLGR